MLMTDGCTTLVVDCDTADNAEMLEVMIDELNLSPAEVFQLFTNEFGLQLFSEEHTVSMLEELGFEEK